MSPISSGRCRPAPDGARHHQHLVHADRRGGVVTEDDHRGRVADQDDVDARLLGDLGGRVVVGGDHHDRLAGPLHLGEPRQRHGLDDLSPTACSGGWVLTAGPPGAGSPSPSNTVGSLSTAMTSLSSSTWTTTGE